MSIHFCQELLASAKTLFEAEESTLANGIIRHVIDYLKDECAIQYDVVLKYYNEILEIDNLDSNIVITLCERCILITNTENSRTRNTSPGVVPLMRYYDKPIAIYEDRDMSDEVITCCNNMLNHLTNKVDKRKYWLMIASKMDQSTDNQFINKLYYYKKAASGNPTKNLEEYQTVITANIQIAEMYKGYQEQVRKLLQVDAYTTSYVHYRKAIYLLNELCNLFCDNEEACRKARARIERLKRSWIMKEFNYKMTKKRTVQQIDDNDNDDNNNDDNNNDDQVSINLQIRKKTKKN